MLCNCSFLPFKLNLVDKVVVITLVAENIVMSIVGIKGRPNKDATAATPNDKITDTIIEVPYKYLIFFCFLFTLVIFFSDPHNFLFKNN